MKKPTKLDRDFAQWLEDHRCCQESIDVCRKYGFAEVILRAGIGSITLGLMRAENDGAITWEQVDEMADWTPNKLISFVRREIEFVDAPADEVFVMNWDEDYRINLQL